MQFLIMISQGGRCFAFMGSILTGLPIESRQQAGSSEGQTRGKIDKKWGAQSSLSKFCSRF